VEWSLKTAKRQRQVNENGSKESATLATEQQPCVNASSDIRRFKIRAPRSSALCALRGARRAAVERNEFMLRTIQRHKPRGVRQNQQRETGKSATI
jgi:hypothetical protein